MSGKGVNETSGVGTERQGNAQCRTVGVEQEVGGEESEWMRRDEGK